MRIERDGIVTYRKEGGETSQEQRITKLNLP